MQNCNFVKWLLKAVFEVELECYLSSLLYKYYFYFFASTIAEICSPPPRGDYSQTPRGTYTSLKTGALEIQKYTLWFIVPFLI